MRKKIVCFCLKPDKIARIPGKEFKLINWIFNSITGNKRLTKVLLQDQSILIAKLTWSEK